MYMWPLVATLAFSGPTASPNLFYGCVSADSQSLPYCNATLSAAARAEDLTSRLSLSEKIAQLSPTKPPYCACHTAPATAAGGVPMYRWLTEVNSVVSAPCVAPGQCPTQFIGPLGTAASFNDSAWYAKGDVVSTDMRALFNSYGGADAYSDAAVGLTGFGPNINTVRDPRFGRNSELAGEDPYLSGRYASAYVKGMQQRATGAGGQPLYKMRAYLKHYTAYSVETSRFTFSANLSAFDLHDSNLPQYAAAMTGGGASGAMCSYFAPDGVSACGNEALLNGQIRTTWERPDAVVMSDCSAVANMQRNVMNLTGEQAAATALNAGLDVYGGWQDNLWGDGHLRAAIRAGLASEATLDAAVRRTLAHKMSVGLFDDPATSPWAALGAADLNSTAAQAAAYDVALQGAVLLRNDAGALPLRSGAGASLAVLGPLGNDSFLYLSDYAEQAIAQHHPSLLDTLRAANPAASTTFAMGTAGVTAANATAAAEAVAAAKAAEQIVLVLGITKVQEHEAIDRADTLLPRPQLALARQVLAAAAGKPVVVVLINGGILSVDLRELLPAGGAGADSDGAGGASSSSSSPSSPSSSSRVALVEAFNPAGQGARALSSLIFGAENRWGKLPVTIYPKEYANSTTLQNMSFANRSYRYFTGAPLWRFGDGLSYTTFAHNCTCGARHVVGEECCCGVANTGGARRGDEVLLLYHAAGDAVRTRAQRDHPVPLRALVDFARVGLEPGEATTVCFATGRERFALTDAHGDRVVYPGEHQLIFSRGNGHETSATFAL